jgi:hypothetical protein
MCKSMGLILCFRCEPSPPALDIADDGLAALMNVNMLYRNLLLAFPAVTIERIEQDRIGARQYFRLVQILLLSLKRLITQRSAPITFHRGVMASNELRRDHAFELIPRFNADQGIYRSKRAA